MYYFKKLYFFYCAHKQICFDTITYFYTHTKMVVEVSCARKILAMKNVQRYHESYYTVPVKPGTHGEIISQDMSYETNLIEYIA